MADVQETLLRAFQITKCEFEHYLGPLSVDTDAAWERVTETRWTNCVHYQMRSRPSPGFLLGQVENKDQSIVVTITRHIGAGYYIDDKPEWPCLLHEFNDRKEQALRQWVGTQLSEVLDRIKNAR